MSDRPTDEETSSEEASPEKQRMKKAERATRMIGRSFHRAWNAASSGARQVRQSDTYKLWRAHSDLSSIKSWVVWTCAVLAFCACLAAGVYFVYQLFSSSTAPARRIATKAVERAGGSLLRGSIEITESGEVPVAVVDTAGAIEIEPLEIARPWEVAGALFVRTGPEGAVVIVREHDVWLPEIRSPGAGLEFETEEGGSADVTFAPNPRPLIELRLAPQIGVTAWNANLSGPPAGEFFVAADLLRIGPVHAQLAARYAGGHEGVAGWPVVLEPAAAVRLKGDLFATGRWAVREGEIYYGLSYEL